MEKTTLTLSEHVGEHAHVDRAAPSAYSRLREAAAWAWLASLLACEAKHEGHLQRARGCCSVSAHTCMKC